MKFLSTIFILFFFEFAMGQIPGTPSLFSTNQVPRVYTHSVTSPNSSLITANVIAQVINTAQNPIIASGVLWGRGIPTVASNLGKSTDGIISGGPFTSIANPLPTDVDSINFVAYATTNNGKTYYGKVLTIYRTVTSPYTGRVWMIHNLGAKAMPKEPQTNGDLDSYGNLYQWGRSSDGHEIILPIQSPIYTGQAITGGNPFSSNTTTKPSGYANAPASTFINAGASPNQWNLIDANAGQRDTWQATGINNPCPDGFRVPSSTEFSAETSNFSPQNSSGAFNSFLKLPPTGRRTFVNSLTASGLSYFLPTSGNYWTSTINGTDTRFSNSVYFTSAGTSISTTTSLGRANGLAIRCIKGQPSSGGTAVITSYTPISSSGTMTASVAVSGVTQTFTAAVTTPGTYNISTAPVNGVRFSGSGTLSATGPIVLTASGTPILGTAPPTFNTYVTNTVPFGTFTRTIQGWTTNGTAVVNSYTRINPTPTIILENPISPTETFSADVATPGSYNLTAINNGLTFTASGTFTQTGIQNIVFNAVGTAANTGTYTFTSNTTPAATFQLSYISQTTNGTLIRSIYQGNSQTGTLYAGVSAPVTTKVNLDITYTSNGGNYNISTNPVNGVTFSNTGNIISGPGRQTISLFASGTPIYKGTYTFNTNTTPSMSITVNMDGQASSNGSAIISSVTLGGSTGTIIHPVAVSGVSQTITVNVTKLGTYNISALANGVTYSALGTFTELGFQDITLNASGTPTAPGIYNFTINTSPNVTFTRDVNSQSSNGKAVFESWSPFSSSGSMFVGITDYGTNRETIRAAVTTAGTYNISTNTVNGITFSAPAGGTGASNPFNLELTSSGTPISEGTFEFTTNTTPSFKFSKTVSSGADPSSNGSAIISSITYNTNNLNTYSGAPFGIQANQYVRYIVNASKAGWYNISSFFNGLSFNSYGNIPVGSTTITLLGQGTPIIYGLFYPVLNVSNVTGNSYYAVTVKPNGSTNGNGIISSLNSTSQNGTMTNGVAVSGVSQTHNVTVTRVGDYNLSASRNGVTFAASGTFTSTGVQNIQFNATGTPTTLGTNSFVFPFVTPVLDFTREVFDASSNGSANFSSYTLGASQGTMKVGENVSGVTQTIQVIRGRSGILSYNISATANGVTFSASGNTTSGNIGQTFDIVLTASGTPTAAGNISFNSNTNPVITFTRTIDP
jgi:uncharacterized protein (TIGR02145 family)